MNNGELYKQAFGTLHAPDTVSLTAEKGAERKTFRPGRRLVLVCACTVLALGLAVTAYARGGLILGHVFGWGNNMEVTTGIDENGESYNEVRLHTENLTPPVVQRGGEVKFTGIPGFQPGEKLICFHLAPSSEWSESFSGSETAVRWKRRHRRQPR